MKVTSRCPATVTWATYNADDKLLWYPRERNYIHPSQTSVHSQGRDTIVRLFRGEDSLSTTGWLCQAGPFSDDKHLVLVPPGNGRTSYEIVDWTAHKANAEQMATQISGDMHERTVHPEDQPALGEALTTARLMIGALGTALGSVSPLIGAGSGIAQFLLLAVSPDAKKPPPPPNVEEIEAAVERVFERILRRHKAEESVTDLLLAGEWLLRNSRLVFDELGGDLTKQVSSVREERLRAQLERYSRLDSDLSRQVAYFRNNAKITEFVAPEFISGQMAYLHILRLQVLSQREQGGPITEGDLELYRQEIGKSASALRRVRDVVHSRINDKVESFHLFATPEGREVESILLQAIFDEPSYDLLEQAIQTLDTANKYLDEDIEAVKSDGDPVHFLCSNVEP